MQIELNRRTFLAVLGATTVAMGAGARPLAAQRTPLPPITPLHFFAETLPEPAARPRTAAITYVPLF
jgi:hypothetical protein